MKLHKLQPASSDLSAQTAHLADKYMGRLSNYGSQIAFGLDRNSNRRGGKYPPSRDGEFTTMMETEQFNSELAKGGHGVPLTSEFVCVSIYFGKVGKRDEKRSLPSFPIRVNADSLARLFRLFERSICELKEIGIDFALIRFF